MESLLRELVQKLAQSHFRGELAQNTCTDKLAYRTCSNSCGAVKLAADRSCYENFAEELEWTNRSENFAQSHLRGELAQKSLLAELAQSTESDHPLVLRCEDMLLLTSHPCFQALLETPPMKSETSSTTAAPRLRSLSCVRRVLPMRLHFARLTCGGWVRDSDARSKCLLRLHRSAGRPVKGEASLSTVELAHACGSGTSCIR